jgi:putative FmdB family regulatory protein
MRYDYCCNDCNTEDQLLVFEVVHGMNKQPKVKCPVCNGVNTEKVFLTSPAVYTKGYGWLDVKGRRTDMNKWHLQNKDPYAQYRQPGEKADLLRKLENSGKHQKNPKRYYLSKKKK